MLVDYHLYLIIITHRRKKEKEERNSKREEYNAYICVSFFIFPIHHLASEKSVYMEPAYVIGMSKYRRIAFSCLFFQLA